MKDFLVDFQKILRPQADPVVFQWSEVERGFCFCSG